VELNMLKKMSLPSLLAAALISLAACGGGGAEIKSEITTTSKGQQLIDLKKALDSGAMTQTEYERERGKVLNAK
jgi:hypothetical protein